MQYLFNDDSNLYSAVGEEDNITIPSHIKQIGSIENDIKIYVEDYVYTYLYQYARSGGNKEKLAALAGKRIVIDGQQNIIISGAIQAKNTKEQKGVESFTDETWEYINEQMQHYFKGLCLVGWVHTQPSFGTFLMAKDETFHKEYFKEPWQVLFVIDSLDKLDTFFIHNAEKTGLRPAKGYFIYYEKNQEMQEYMLENSLVRPRLEKQTENIAEEKGEDGTQKKRPTQEQRMDAAKEIRRVLKKRAKEAEEENRSRLTMLAGVSSILCIACLFMGVSLLNNISRVRKLETEIATVQSSYYAMAEQLEEAQTQMVFAAQRAEQQQQEQLKREAEEKAARQKQEEERKAAEEQKRKAEEEQKNSILSSYVVEEGDSLGYISNKFYGTSAGIKDIMQANGINDSNKIICGQTLVIPKR
ncbi:LysM peptidoglycan-binding domain-containing protein [Lachnospiraceae bacterium 46-61]